MSEGFSTLLFEGGLHDVIWHITVSLFIAAFYAYLNWDWCGFRRPSARFKVFVYDNLLFKIGLLFVAWKFCTSSATWLLVWEIKEPSHDKTNKVTCAPSEDSDQPGHPPSVIRVFAVRMKKNTWVLSYPLSAQRRCWSDWADTHPLSLIWVFAGRTGHFAGFVMLGLKCCKQIKNWFHFVILTLKYCIYWHWTFYLTGCLPSKL